MVSQKKYNLQWLFIIGSSAWFASPIFTDLPTIAKCAPILVGLLLGVCIFATPRILLTVNIFTAYAFVGLLYSIVVAALIKEDSGLVLQINMLFIGMLAYYLATPYRMKPTFIMWIIGLVVLPSALGNALMSGVGLQSMLGSFGGRRTEFTIFGGTHHVMGAMGALCILAAWNGYRLKKNAIIDISAISIMVTACVGSALLISSGARAFAGGLVVAFATALLVKMLLKTAPLLACVVPLVLVPMLYWGAYNVNTNVDVVAFLHPLRDADTADVTSGRIAMWEQHMERFKASPVIGHRLADVEPMAMFDNLGNRSHYIAPDGSITKAGTESLFDYVLARDGLSGIVTIGFYYALFLVGIMRRNEELRLVMLFTLASSVGQPLLRITYVLESFVLGVMLAQAYRFGGSSRSSVLES
jgi:hypothetical protein